jgi:hypothetical protein
MGKLFEAVQRVNAVIEARKLDPFRTRGRIAMETGFPLGLIGPTTPDDDVKLAKLKAAAQEVLGASL